ncbi:ATP synthase subunit I [Neorhodopirellula pilleata]|nr:ATP synthase subunit I [Neorhodopirellula pilleata]
MMNDGLALIFAFAAGMLLGCVFFGGLWWTIRKCVATPYPARWMLGSALARMSITLAGFYFVSAGQLKPLLACLVGFIAARLIVTRLTRPAIQVLAKTQETHHAT